MNITIPATKGTPQHTLSDRGPSAGDTNGYSSKPANSYWVQVVSDIEVLLYVYTDSSGTVSWEREDDEAYHPTLLVLIAMAKYFDYYQRNSLYTGDYTNAGTDNEPGPNAHKVQPGAG